MASLLQRETFSTSRLLDFFSEKELAAQCGHVRRDWPLVVVKELIDNALDAAEDAAIASAIDVVVDQQGIEVRDNGPGSPPDTVKAILDFSVRVSTQSEGAFCAAKKAGGGK
jgi:DNA topoisomerase VI subunit B